jgi:hypothetical protein
MLDKMKVVPIHFAYNDRDSVWLFRITPEGEVIWNEDTTRASIMRNQRLSASDQLATLALWYATHLDPPHDSLRGSD